MAQDEKFSRAIQQSLAGLDELYVRMDALEAGPTPGSPAAEDAAKPGGDQTWVYATTAVQVATDHLRAWRHLHLSGMQPPFAHWTLLRAAVEGAVTARWLCDPALPPAKRIGRGLGAGIDDLQQRQGFEGRIRKKMPDVVLPKVAAHTRISQLKKINVPVLPLRGPTELVAMYAPSRGVDAQVLYRALSAFAHHKLWAVPLLGVVVVQGAIPGMPTVARSHVVAHDQLVWLLTDWAVLCVRLAVDDVLAYSGGQPPA